MTMSKLARGLVGIPVKCVLSAWMVMLCVAWAQERPAPNTLTPAEQKEGFRLLFDGKSLDQWDVPPVPGVWSIVDGAIKSNSRLGADAAAMLFTKEDFDNYVLKAEFRTTADIHAHIFLRQRRRRPPANPATAATKTATTAAKKGGAREIGGYELQIRDKDPVPRKGGSYLTASIVNVGMAPADAKIIPGQWNSFEVTMNGDHMIVIYNGRKVVDGHDNRRSTGAIALHLAQPEEAPGTEVEFRNLKVKRLP